MKSVIVGLARTPIGRFGGGLKPLPATGLGSAAIGGALESAAVPPDAVDEVIFGHVVQAGAGQITARQAATGAGIPMTVPATTINKVCLSGLTAIAMADRSIRLDESDVIVAGGMESMSNAPYLLPDARWGGRLGHGPLVDAMQHDGLFCAFDECSMGEAADLKNEALGIFREEQDEWSAASHQRAAAARDSGHFANEIVAVDMPARRGQTVQVEHDEGIRDEVTVGSLAGLRPVFTPEGTTTVGNASQISDGGAAVVVASERAAADLGAEPIAEVVSYGQVAGPDATLHERPAEAIQAALDRAGLSASDLDVVEINEAFASVALWSARMLDLDPASVNPNGGAVALGHPPRGDRRPPHGHAPERAAASRRRARRRLPLWRRRPGRRRHRARRLDGHAPRCSAISSSSRASARPSPGPAPTGPPTFDRTMTPSGATSPCSFSVVPKLSA